MNNFCEKYADKLIWAFIFIYVCAFSYVCFAKYYSFGYYDMDFASDVAVYWNSLHGKMLYFPFLQENIFGVHLYLISLLIMPVYALFQHPATILFLQSLILGLAAYPLYLFAKLKLDKTFALAIGSSYLLYPSLGFINLFETHFDSFALFFLFFAFYYFEKEKFNKFLAFILLAIACKENVSLVVFMFGIYAFLRKRPKKWVILPLVLGAGWFVLALKLVIPFFAGEAKSYQEGFIWNGLYRHLGRDMFEMAGTILRHPVIAARFAFMPRKILYLIYLFVPVGFISLLSPGALLMALPILMQNLLSSGLTHAQIRYQYVATLIPFIFCSAVFAFKKLLEQKAIYPERNKLLAAFLIFPIVTGAYLGAPQLNILRYLENYKISDLTREKDRLIATIPGDASVIASFQFLPKLAHRHNLYSLHFVSNGFKMLSSEKYEPAQDLEYALVDFNEPLMVSAFFPQEAPRNIRAFLEKGDWRVLKSVDDIVLFKKDYPRQEKLWETAQNPEIQHAVNADIDSQILFLGYDLDGRIKDNLLHFTFYWKKVNPSDRDLVFLIQFLDANGNLKLSKEHIFGYRISLPKDWPPDEVFKEEYRVLVPQNLASGNYKILAMLYRLEDGKILPVLAEGRKSELIDLGTAAVIR